MSFVNEAAIEIVSWYDYQTLEDAPTIICESLLVIFNSLDIDDLFSTGLPISDWVAGDDSDNNSLMISPGLSALDLLRTQLEQVLVPETVETSTVSNDQTSESSDNTAKSGESSVFNGTLNTEEQDRSDLAGLSHGTGYEFDNVHLESLSDDIFDNDNLHFNKYKISAQNSLSSIDYSYSGPSTTHNSYILSSISNSCSLESNQSSENTDMSDPSLHIRQLFKCSSESEVDRTEEFMSSPDSVQFEYRRDKHCHNEPTFEGISQTNNLIHSDNAFNQCAFDSIGKETEQISTDKVSRIYNSSMDFSTLNENADGVHTNASDDSSPECVRAVNEISTGTDHDQVNDIETDLLGCHGAANNIGPDRTDEQTKMDISKSDSSLLSVADQVGNRLCDDKRGVEDSMLRNQESLDSNISNGQECTSDSQGTSMPREHSSTETDTFETAAEIGQVGNNTDSNSSEYLSLESSQEFVTELNTLEKSIHENKKLDNSKEVIECYETEEALQQATWHSPDKCKYTQFEIIGHIVYLDNEETEIAKPRERKSIVSEDKDVCSHNDFKLEENVYLLSDEGQRDKNQTEPNICTHMKIASMDSNEALLYEEMASAQLKYSISTKNTSPGSSEFSETVSAVLKEDSKAEEVASNVLNENFIYTEMVSAVLKEESDAQNCESRDSKASSDYDNSALNILQPRASAYENLLSEEDFSTGSYGDLQSKDNTQDEANKREASDKDHCGLTNSKHEHFESPSANIDYKLSDNVHFDETATDTLKETATRNIVSNDSKEFLHDDDIMASSFVKDENECYYWKKVEDNRRIDTDQEECSAQDSDHTSNENEIEYWRKVEKDGTCILVKDEGNSNDNEHCYWTKVEDIETCNASLKELNANENELCYWKNVETISQNENNVKTKEFEDLKHDQAVCIEAHINDTSQEAVILSEECSPAGITEILELQIEAVATNDDNDLKYRETDTSEKTFVLMEEPSTTEKNDTITDLASYCNQVDEEVIKGTIGQTDLQTTQSSIVTEHNIQPEESKLSLELDTENEMSTNFNETKLHTEETVIAEKLDIQTEVSDMAGELYKQTEDIVITKELYIQTEEAANTEQHEMQTKETANFEELDIQTESIYKAKEFDLQSEETTISEELDINMKVKAIAGESVIHTEVTVFADELDTKTEETALEGKLDILTEKMANFDKFDLEIADTNSAEELNKQAVVTAISDIQTEVTVIANELDQQMEETVIADEIYTHIEETAIAEEINRQTEGNARTVKLDIQTEETAIADELPLQIGESAVADEVHIQIEGIATSDDFNIQSEETATADECNIQTEETSIAEELNIQTVETTTAEELNIQTEETAIAEDLNLKSEETAIAEGLNIQIEEKTTSDELNIHTEETATSVELNIIKEETAEELNIQIEETAIAEELIIQREETAVAEDIQHKIIAVCNELNIQTEVVAFDQDLNFQTDHNDQTDIEEKLDMQIEKHKIFTEGTAVAEALKIQTEETAIAKELHLQTQDTVIADELNLQTEKTVNADVLDLQTEETVFADEIHTYLEETAIGEEINIQSEEIAIAEESKTQTEETAIAEEFNIQTEETAIAEKLHIQTKETAVAEEVHIKIAEIATTDELNIHTEGTTTSEEEIIQTQEIAEELKIQTEETAIAEELNVQTEETSIAQDLNFKAEEPTIPKEFHTQTEETAIPEELNIQLKITTIAEELDMQTEETAIAEELNTLIDEIVIAEEPNTQTEKFVIADEIYTQTEETAIAEELNIQAKLTTIAEELNTQTEETAIAEELNTLPDEIVIADEIYNQTEEEEPNIQEVTTIADELNTDIEETAIAEEINIPTEETAFADQLSTQTEETAIAEELNTQTDKIVIADEIYTEETAIVEDLNIQAEEIYIAEDLNLQTEKIAVVEELYIQTEETAIADELGIQIEETATSEEFNMQTKETTVAQDIQHEVNTVGSELNIQTEEVAFVEDLNLQTDRTAIVEDIDIQTQKLKILCEVTALPEALQIQTEEKAIAKEFQGQTQEAAIANELYSQTEKTVIANELDLQTKETAIPDEIYATTEETGISKELYLQTEENASAQSLDIQTEETAIADELHRQTKESGAAEERNQQTEETAVDVELHKQIEITAVANEIHTQIKETATSDILNIQTEDQTAIAEIFDLQTKGTCSVEEIKILREETAVAEELNINTEETIIAEELHVQAEEKALADELNIQTQETSVAEEINIQTEEIAVAKELFESVVVDHIAITEELDVQIKETTSTDELDIQTEVTSVVEELHIPTKEIASTEEFNVQTEVSAVTDELDIQTDVHTVTDQLYIQTELAAIAENINLQTGQTVMAEELDIQTKQSVSAEEIEILTEETAMTMELSILTEETVIIKELNKQIEETAVMEELDIQTEETAIADEVDIQTAFAEDLSIQTEEIAVVTEIQTQTEETVIAKELNIQTENATVVEGLDKQTGRNIQHEETAIADEQEILTHRASRFEDLNIQTEETAVAKKLNLQTEEAAVVEELDKRTEETTIVDELNVQNEETAIAEEFSIQTEEIAVSENLDTQLEVTAIANELEILTDAAALFEVLNIQTEETAFAKKNYTQTAETVLVNIQTKVTEVNIQTEDTAVADEVYIPTEEFAVELKTQTEETAVNEELDTQHEVTVIADELEIQSDTAAIAEDQDKRTEEIVISKELNVQTAEIGSTEKLDIQTEEIFTTEKLYAQNEETVTTDELNIETEELVIAVELNLQSKESAVAKEIYKQTEVTTVAEEGHIQAEENDFNEELIMQTEVPVIADELYVLTEETAVAEELDIQTKEMAIADKLDIPAGETASTNDFHTETENTVIAEECNLKNDESTIAEGLGIQTEETASVEKLNIQPEETVSTEGFNIQTEVATFSEDLVLQTDQTAIAEELDIQTNESISAEEINEQNKVNVIPEELNIQTKETANTEDFHIQTEETAMALKLDIQNEETAIAKELNMQTEDTALAEKLNLQTEETALAEKFDIQIEEIAIAEELNVLDEETPLCEELDMQTEKELVIQTEESVYAEELNIQTEENALAEKFNVQTEKAALAEEIDIQNEEIAIAEELNILTEETPIFEKLNIQTDKVASTEKDDMQPEITDSTHKLDLQTAIADELNIQAEEINIVKVPILQIDQIATAEKLDIQTIKMASAEKLEIQTEVSAVAEEIHIQIDEAAIAEELDKHIEEIAITEKFDEQTEEMTSSDELDIQTEVSAEDPKLQTEEFSSTEADITDINDLPAEEFLISVKNEFQFNESDLQMKESDATEDNYVQIEEPVITHNYDLQAEKSVITDEKNLQTEEAVNNKNGLQIENDVFTKEKKLQLQEDPIPTKYPSSAEKTSVTEKYDLQCEASKNEDDNLQFQEATVTEENNLQIYEPDIADKIDLLTERADVTEVNDFQVERDIVSEESLSQIEDAFSKKDGVLQTEKAFITEDTDLQTNVTNMSKMNYLQSEEQCINDENNLQNDHAIITDLDDLSIKDTVAIQDDEFQTNQADQEKLQTKKVVTAEENNEHIEEDVTEENELQTQDVSMNEKNKIQGEEAAITEINDLKVGEDVKTGDSYLQTPVPVINDKNDFKVNTSDSSDKILILSKKADATEFNDLGIEEDFTKEKFEEFVNSDMDGIQSEESAIATEYVLQKTNHDYTAENSDLQNRFTAVDSIRFEEPVITEANNVHTDKAATIIKTNDPQKVTEDAGMTEENDFQTDKTLMKGNNKFKIVGTEITEAFDLQFEEVDILQAEETDNTDENEIGLQTEEAVTTEVNYLPPNENETTLVINSQVEEAVMAEEHNLQTKGAIRREYNQSQREETLETGVNYLQIEVIANQDYLSEAEAGVIEEENNLEMDYSEVEEAAIKAVNVEEPNSNVSTAISYLQNKEVCSIEDNDLQMEEAVIIEENDIQTEEAPFVNENCFQFEEVVTEKNCSKTEEATIDETYEIASIPEDSYLQVEEASITEMNYLQTEDVVLTESNTLHSEETATTKFDDLQFEENDITEVNELLVPDEAAISEENNLQPDCDIITEENDSQLKEASITESNDLGTNELIKEEKCFNYEETSIANVDGVQIDISEENNFQVEETSLADVTDFQREEAAMTAEEHDCSEVEEFSITKSNDLQIEEMTDLQSQEAVITEESDEGPIITEKSHLPIEAAVVTKGNDLQNANDVLTEENKLQIKGAIMNEENYFQIEEQAIPDDKMTGIHAEDNVIIEETYLQVEEESSTEKKYLITEEACITDGTDLKFQESDIPGENITKESAMTETNDENRVKDQLSERKTNTMNQVNDVGEDYIVKTTENREVSCEKLDEILLSPLSPEMTDESEHMGLSNISDAASINFETRLFVTVDDSPSEDANDCKSYDLTTESYKEEYKKIVFENISLNQYENVPILSTGSDAENISINSSISSQGDTQTFLDDQTCSNESDTEETDTFLKKCVQDISLPFTTEEVKQKTVHDIDIPSERHICSAGVEAEGKLQAVVSHDDSTSEGYNPHVDIPFDVTETHDKVIKERERLNSIDEENDVDVIDSDSQKDSESQELPLNIDNDLLPIIEETNSEMETSMEQTDKSFESETSDLCEHIFDEYGENEIVMTECDAIADKVESMHIQDTCSGASKLDEDLKTVEKYSETTCNETITIAKSGQDEEKFKEVIVVQLDHHTLESNIENEKLSFTTDKSDPEILVMDPKAEQTNHKQPNKISNFIEGDTQTFEKESYLSDQDFAVDNEGVIDGVNDNDSRETSLRSSGEMSVNLEDHHNAILLIETDPGTEMEGNVSADNNKSQGLISDTTENSGDVFNEGECVQIDNTNIVVNSMDNRADKLNLHEDSEKNAKAAIYQQSEEISKESMIMANVQKHDFPKEEINVNNDDVFSTGTYNEEDIDDNDDDDDDDEDDEREGEDFPCSVREGGGPGYAGDRFDNLGDDFTKPKRLSIINEETDIDLNDSSFEEGEKQGRRKISSSSNTCDEPNKKVCNDVEAVVSSTDVSDVKDEQKIHKDKDGMHSFTSSEASDTNQVEVDECDTAGEISIVDSIMSNESTKGRGDFHPQLVKDHQIQTGRDMGKTQKVANLRHSDKNNDVIVDKTKVILKHPIKLDMEKSDYSALSKETAELNNISDDTGKLPVESDSTMNASFDSKYKLVMCDNESKQRNPPKYVTDKENSLHHKENFKDLSKLDDNAEQLPKKQSGKYIDEGLLKQRKHSERREIEKSPSTQMTSQNSNRSHEEDNEIIRKKQDKDNKVEIASTKSMEHRENHQKDHSQMSTADSKRKLDDNITHNKGSKIQTDNMCQNKQHQSEKKLTKSKGIETVQQKDIPEQSKLLEKSSPAQTSPAQSSPAQSINTMFRSKLTADLSRRGEYNKGWRIHSSSSHTEPSSDDMEDTASSSKHSEQYTKPDNDANTSQAMNAYSQNDYEADFIMDDEHFDDPDICQDISDEDDYQCYGDKSDRLSFESGDFIFSHDDSCSTHGQAEHGMDEGSEKPYSKMSKEEKRSTFRQASTQYNTVIQMPGTEHDHYVDNDIDDDDDNDGDVWKSMDTDSRDMTQRSSSKNKKQNSVDVSKSPFTCSTAKEQVSNSGSKRDKSLDIWLSRDVDNTARGYVSDSQKAKPRDTNSTARGYVSDDSQYPRKKSRDNMQSRGGDSCGEYYSSDNPNMQTKPIDDYRNLKAIESRQRQVARRKHNSEDRSGSSDQDLLEGEGQVASHGYHRYDRDTNRTLDRQTGYMKQLHSSKSLDCGNSEPPHSFLKPKHDSVSTQDLASLPQDYNNRQHDGNYNRDYRSKVAHSDPTQKHKLLKRQSSSPGYGEQHYHKVDNIGEIDYDLVKRRQSDKGRLAQQEYDNLPQYLSHSDSKQLLDDYYAAEAQYTPKDLHVREPIQVWTLQDQHRRGSNEAAQAANALPKKKGQRTDSESLGSYHDRGGVRRQSSQQSVNVDPRRSSQDKSRSDSKDSSGSQDKRMSEIDPRDSYNVSRDTSGSDHDRFELRRRYSEQTMYMDMGTASNQGKSALKRRSSERNLITTSGAEMDRDRDKAGLRRRSSEQALNAAIGQLSEDKWRSDSKDSRDSRDSSEPQYDRADARRRHSQQSLQSDLRRSSKDELMSRKNNLQSAKYHDNISHSDMMEYPHGDSHHGDHSQDVRYRGQRSEVGYSRQLSSSSGQQLSRESHGESETEMLSHCNNSKHAYHDRQPHYDSSFTESSLEQRLPPQDKLFITSKLQSSNEYTPEKDFNKIKREYAAYSRKQKTQIQETGNDDTPEYLERGHRSTNTRSHGRREYAERGEISENYSKSAQDLNYSSAPRYDGSNSRRGSEITGSQRHVDSKYDSEMDATQRHTYPRCGSNRQTDSRLPSEDNTARQYDDTHRRLKDSKRESDADTQRRQQPDTRCGSRQEASRQDYRGDADDLHGQSRRGSSVVNTYEQQRQPAETKNNHRRTNQDSLQQQQYLEQSQNLPLLRGSREEHSKYSDPLYNSSHPQKEARKHETQHSNQAYREPQLHGQNKHTKHDKPEQNAKAAQQFYEQSQETNLLNRDDIYSRDSKLRINNQKQTQSSRHVQITGHDNDKRNDRQNRDRNTVNQYDYDMKTRDEKALAYDRRSGIPMSNQSNVQVNLERVDDHQGRSRGYRGYQEPGTNTRDGRHTGGYKTGDKATRTYKKDGPLSLTDAYGSMDNHNSSNHAGHALSQSTNQLSGSMTSLNKHAPMASPSRQGTLQKQTSLQSSTSEINGGHREEVEGIKFERLKNLPEDDLMVKIKEILSHFEKLEDFHRGDGMRIQKMLGDMYWDYTHMREMIGDCMADSGYAGLAMNMLKTLNGIGIFKNDDVWFPTYYTYNTMWNFTDASSRLAQALSEHDAVRLLTLNCGHKPYINALHSKNVYYVIKASLSILHNIARNSGMKHLFDENKTSETIMPFLESDDEMLKILATLTISNIVDEEENKSLITETGTIHCMVSWIEKALGLPRRRYKGFTPQELTEGLNKLAVNDSNKLKIVEEGALPLFLKMLQHDDVREQSSAARVIWTVSFDKEVREKIKEVPELMAQLQKLTESTNKSLQMNSTGALWVIKGENDVSKENEDDPVSKRRAKSARTKSHVFLSYSWSDKETVLQIRDRLRAEGYALWIDIEKMGGSTLEGMATAVENSAVVLICMSEKYKQSPNCRTEAEYTFQLRKDYIPIMMQKKYRPDGWLGIILGAKLYFDFSGKYPFDKSFQGLVKELRGRGKVTPQQTPGEVNDHTDAAIIHSTSLSSHASYGTPVHPVPSNSVIHSMGQEELIKWLRNIKLTDCIPAFMEFDGRLLMQLKIMRSEAPEFFYQCLEKRLNMSLIEILKFTRALEELH